MQFQRGDVIPLILPSHKSTKRGCARAHAAVGIDRLQSCRKLFAKINIGNVTRACTYECTFCATCVDTVLENVGPELNGG
jgi:hypothetical protein